ncbi:LuxR C-terminal-related transcriptional regulator [Nonomuraea sp. NPDC055795]
MQATGSRADIGFGAFAHLLPTVRPDSPNLLGWAAGQLGDKDPLLLVVDDAHLLDPMSAALVRHLVQHTPATLLATARGMLPPPLRPLARAVTLEPLTAEQMGALLAQSLGERVEGSTVLRLRHAAAGDLRLLRELVRSSVESGDLARTGGPWRLTGELPVSPALCELVEGALGELDEREREALELVSMAATLDADLLLEQVCPQAVVRLEQRGLLVTHQHNARLRVRLSPPIYGSVIRSWMGPLRARERLARLGRPLEPQPQEPGAQELTPRELEIAQLASWGMTNREIGHCLGVSHRTIGNHIYRLYIKTGNKDRNQLASAS